jgi:Na+-translocating ferredoxin:NAD+ oxidoreductase RnfD subunit
MDEAKRSEAESHQHVESHNTLARSVTLFQIAIAIGAISILIKKRIYWIISLGFACVATFFFVLELLGR